MVVFVMDLDGDSDHGLSLIYEELDLGADYNVPLAPPPRSFISLLLLTAGIGG